MGLKAGAERQRRLRPLWAQSEHTDRGELHTKYIAAYLTIIRYLAHHAGNMARASRRRDYSLLNNIGAANNKVRTIARLDAILKRKLMKISKLTMLVVAAILVTSHARAQVTVEVGKITCHQFLAFSVADPKDIAIWLSGYYHGKHGTSNFEPQTFKANFDKLKSACYLKENYNLPVMQVIEKTLGASK